MTTGWTRADQAELDVIIHDFIETCHVHLYGCSACYRLNRWCPPLEQAWSTVEVWLYRRRLLSKAQWLRDEERLRA